MPVQSTEKWNSENPEKVTDSGESLSILPLFSDCQYSISKCPELACKVNQPPGHLHKDPPGWKKSRIFACHLEAFRSSYCKSNKNAIIVESSGIWHLFSDWRYSSAFFQPGEGSGENGRPGASILPPSCPGDAQNPPNADVCCYF